MRPGARVVLGLLAMNLLASAAEADLVRFRTGRTMSVDSYRIEGDRITLRLRRGGEIVCALALVAGVDRTELTPRPGTSSVLPGPAETGRVRFRALVSDIAAREGVDAGLIHAVIAVESAYQAEARSAKGAMGLMQLMPATAKQYAVEDPYDPRSNIEAGTRHLRRLLERFELSLALAAYNAGAQAVATYAGIPPYPETRSYVARVLERLALAPGSE